MAEQMAEAIQSLILSGELESGAALPTEPELAQQFEVSRAVVRDATRILMARGLVAVEHGRGVFVTQPQNEAFGEALLLALRRGGATAWDVEQFDQLIFPEVIALATVSASDEEILRIQNLIKSYLQIVSDHHTNWWNKEVPATELEGLLSASRQIMQAIYDATHNQVFQQLAQPLLKLRNLRDWVGAEDESAEIYIGLEAAYFDQLTEAILSRDPTQARSIVSRLMELPPEAITAMSQTPVGERSIIPIPFSKLSN